MRSSVILVVALVAGACSLDRHGLAAEPVLDAEVPPGDADVPDAPLEDADVPDASFDAGIDAAVCIPASESCDLTDQDCDGRVDEEACAGCNAFEHGGHVYQDCPSVTGHAAWGGACRRIGPGYDLVVIGTAAEDEAIDTATSEESWIGLNDFDANGTYIWVDRSPPAYLGTWASGEGLRDGETCFLMRGGGEWDDDTCSDSRRVICEGDPADRCVRSAEDDAVCDGIDGDCDGAVDEDCALGAGCTSLTFWDHAFLTCTLMAPAAAAEALCAPSGYALATIDNATENAAIASVVGEVWIGLRQTPAAPSPSAGWSWVDGSVSSYRNWGGGPQQPDDSNGSENGQEDCTRMRPSDDWGDLGCDTPLPFVCRRDFAL